MGAQWIPGADRTSRFYGNKFPNADMGGIDKLLAHSTETPKTSGCPGYASGTMAPTITINPWKGYQKRWQHFAITKPARALANPSSTPVSENKDRVFQAEIIGYSDPALGRKYGCYLLDLTTTSSATSPTPSPSWPRSTACPRCRRRGRSTRSPRGRR